MVGSLIALIGCVSICVWTYFLLTKEIELAKKEYEKALVEKDRSIASFTEYLEFVVKYADEMGEEEKNFITSSLKETRKSLH